MSVLSFPIPAKCGWKTNLDVYALDLELAKAQVLNQLAFLQDHFESEGLLTGRENGGKHVAFSLSANLEIFRELHDFFVAEFEVDFRETFRLQDHVMTFLRKEIVAKQ